MLARWHKDDHPVATAVFAAVMVLLGIVLLGVLILLSSLDDLQIVPDCLGNC